MGRKPYDDDDGRVIADMSGISARTPFGHFRMVDRHADGEKPDHGEKSARPWENSGISREARRGAVWGALTAALLIALAFIVGLGLVIAALYLIRA